MTTASPLELAPPESDWRWQLRHAVRSWEELERWVELSSEERRAAALLGPERPPLLITPYYLSLLRAQDPGCPLRRQVVPSAEEAGESAGDLVDPLGEEQHEVAPDLVRRYPDRALYLLTDRCATHCRFCTRSRLVGRAPWVGSAERRQLALEYLHSHPEVRDVIVSGGDPLVLSTRRLVELLRELRAVPSVETIRLATRTLTVLPQRVTAELIEALGPFHPLWVMTHFNHPRELTELARAACRRLADAGFPLMNQTVLLAGVNDDAEVLAELFRGLVRERVRPYYLLQMDPVAGTGHLRTPLARGVELMAALQGRVSGIALPKFIVDTPGGYGKVPMAKNAVIAEGQGVTWLRTAGGVEVEYWDPESGGRI